MEEVDRRVGTAARQAVHYRNYRRCRDRALRRLAQENPDRYRELLEQEKANDEAEGKSWLDITGRTKRSVGSAGAPNGRSKVPIIHTDRDDEAEGELG